MRQIDSQVDVDSFFNHSLLVFKRALVFSLADKIFIKSVLGCLHVCLRLLLSAVLFQLVLGNGDDCEAECKACDESLLCCNLTIAILAPIGSPSVLEDPHISAFDVVPTNHLNDMVTLHLEAILGPEINAITVGKEIGVNLEHGQDRTILDYLTLDTFGSLSDTVVNHSENVLILATRVSQEMIFGA